MWATVLAQAQHQSLSFPGQTWLEGVKDGEGRSSHWTITNNNKKHSKHQPTTISYSCILWVLSNSICIWIVCSAKYISGSWPNCQWYSLASSMWKVANTYNKACKVQTNIKPGLEMFTVQSNKIPSVHSEGKVPQIHDCSNNFIPHRSGTHQLILDFGPKTVNVSN